MDQERQPAPSWAGVAYLLSFSPSLRPDEVLQVSDDL